MKTAIVILGAFLALPLFAQTGVDRAEPSRIRRNRVLVPAVTLESGAVIAAFSRKSERLGFSWIEGGFEEDGSYRAGYWKPLGREFRDGGEMVWEPGHQSPSGWVEGYWRIPVRPGFEWVRARYDREGRWREGRWKRISLYPPENPPGPPYTPKWTAGFP